jgi:hypothetical protein|tara:strand:- start:86 stop:544 length:459 start_codon:yes stop_codon:yes gene_type:complete
MYNFKQGKGTYKGLIGECLFKLTRRYLILTTFFNKNKYLKIFGNKFSEQEKCFINQNWFSIDGIEFDYSKTPRKVILFEIKTKNYYLNPKPNWIPKMTLATHNMYNETLKVGLDVKIAIVWLYNNWDYDIEIKDFNQANYCIDKPKRYDRGL